ncbi:MAG: response regulator [Thermoplasmatota archaeon]
MHGDRPTILLVDDEDDVRDSILDLLQSVLPRARILSAATAEEGLRILEREGADVVVSDYRLPGMDGLRFLAQASRLLPGVPRILITAYTEIEVDDSELAAARPEAVLTKPLEAADLVARVRSALVEAPGRFVREA